MEHISGPGVVVVGQKNALMMIMNLTECLTMLPPLLLAPIATSCCSYSPRHSLMLLINVAAGCH